MIILAGITFDARHLAAANPGTATGGEQADTAAVPDPADFLLCVAHLIRLGLLEGRPPIDWLSRRLGLSRRALQRRFEAHGTSFLSCLTAVRTEDAKRLLAATDRPIGQIALDLGYADPAHFSRAFQDWTGCPPTAWRRGVRP